MGETLQKMADDGEFEDIDISGLDPIEAFLETGKISHHWSIVSAFV